MDLVIFNIAIGRHPLDHPEMAGFAGQMAEVNALAQSSPGFIWAASDGEAGDAPVVFGHPLVMPNISTWASIETLQAFVYKGPHASALRRRHEWFEELPPPFYVLWWTAPGARPTWIEAKSRLATLAARGPSAEAFTFTQPFAPDASLDTASRARTSPRRDQGGLRR